MGRRARATGQAVRALGARVGSGAARLVAVKLTPEELRALDAHARSRRTTRSAVLREGLRALGPAG